MKKMTDTKKAKREEAKRKSDEAKALEEAQTQARNEAVKKTADALFGEVKTQAYIGANAALAAVLAGAELLIMRRVFGNAMPSGEKIRKAIQEKCEEGGQSPSTGRRWANTSENFAKAFAAQYDDDEQLIEVYEAGNVAASLASLADTLCEGSKMGTTIGGVLKALDLNRKTGKPNPSQGEGEGEGEGEGDMSPPSQLDRVAVDKALEQLALDSNADAYRDAIFAEYQRLKAKEDARESADQAAAAATARVAA
jgi:hypothetical protein